MTKTYTLKDMEEGLHESLAKTVPFTKEGNGWKVWLRNEDGSYRCVALVPTNSMAHVVRAGLISDRISPAEIEITRGGTIGINISEREG